VETGIIFVHVCRSRIFIYRILGELTSSSTIAFKVGLAHRDKAKIKCMGSIGGKTPTEPKVYSSLTLGMLRKMKLMFMCFA
jgi:hypothetical protein